jgi:hypothetical protein
VRDSSGRRIKSDFYFRQKRGIAAVSQIPILRP